jgi:hypothetical protein
MRLCVPYLGALLIVAVGASTSQAQYPFPVRPLPAYCPAPPLPAPGFGPGGPVYPTFPPFQGMLPVPQPAGQQQIMFGSHAFVRSPRDFYMVD